MKILNLIVVILFTVASIFIACNNTKRVDIKESVFISLPTNYASFSFKSQQDTLNLNLDAKTFNNIKSLASFEQNGTSYVSFLDVRSKSINIYDTKSGRLLKKMILEDYFSKDDLKGLSVYVKDIDSIFIANKKAVYLIDTAGHLKLKVEYAEDNGGVAILDNSSPPFMRNGSLYTGIKPKIDELSFTDISRSRALYHFILNDQKQELIYQLPKIYTEKILGDNFLKANFCINDKGNIVFSFPADTNIYETDLSQYHKSYLGKSKYQTDLITPVPKIELERDNGFKQYSIRDSYGPIYFDAFNKQYLRVFRQKMSDSAYESNRVKRKYSIVVLDHSFKIIGEGELPQDISYSSIFFSNGYMYARTNFEDEYALHFVKLSYNVSDITPKQQIVGL